MVQIHRMTMRQSGQIQSTIAYTGGRLLMHDIMQPVRCSFTLTVTDYAFVWWRDRADTWSTRDAVMIGIDIVRFGLNTRWFHIKTNQRSASIHN